MTILHVVRTTYPRHRSWWARAGGPAGLAYRKQPVVYDAGRGDQAAGITSQGRLCPTSKGTTISPLNQDGCYPPPWWELEVKTWGIKLCMLDPWGTDYRSRVSCVSLQQPPSARSEYSSTTEQSMIWYSSTAEQSMIWYQLYC
ncbi:hypothetical protein ACOMHN_058190 [Nucella lapillus]